MRPEQKDLAYLWDMLDAAKAIQEFAEGKTFHHYLNERMLRGAVERQLEIIGEAIFSCRGEPCVRPMARANTRFAPTVEYLFHWNWV